MQKLLNHESNIWNCIYRMVDSNEPIGQSTELDQEELKEDQARMQRLSTMFERNRGGDYKTLTTFNKNYPRTKTNDLFGKQVTMTNSSNDIIEDIGKSGSMISDLERPNLDHAQKLIMSATIRRNSIGGEQTNPILTKDALKSFQNHLTEEASEFRPSNPYTQRQNQLEEIEERDSFGSDDSMHQVEDTKTEEKLSKKGIKLREIERNSNVQFYR